MRVPRELGIRALLLSVITTGVFASGVRSLATSSQATSQQSQLLDSQADLSPAKTCDIEGPVNDFEDCPAETIIAQYKEQDVDVVLLGGVYWAVFTGEYVNEQYRYKVDLPEGAQALYAPPPAPFHGFFIDLAQVLTPPEEPSRSHGSFPYYNWDVGVSVTGYYNSAEFASADELVSHRLSREDVNESDFIVLEKARTRLRGIPAIHYVLQFTNPESGETIISDNIVAIRKSSFVYEIGLTTLASRYVAERPFLEQVIKGWRLLPFYE